MTPDLLSRLAAATEGSAELDREVLLACGWTDRGEGRIAFRWVDPEGVRHSVEPRPTRSLDDIDAMIHEAGMEWFKQWAQWTHDDDGACSAVSEVFVVSLTAQVANWHLAEHSDTRLALCIAFLRAMEAGR